MISIPRPRPGDRREEDQPCSVVHDLDTDRAGFGPEGQLDGVARGRREVGVFDAVARGLVHGEHQVVSERLRSGPVELSQLRTCVRIDAS